MRNNQFHYLVSLLGNPKELSKHLLNEEHSFAHRITFGTIVIFVGVGITKAAALFHSLPVHIFADGLGYLIHGIGAVPYVQYLAQIGEGNV